jgi:hypothetical protein
MRFQRDFYIATATLPDGIGVVRRVRTVPYKATPEYLSSVIMPVAM